ncbi:MAG: PAS domain S-box protein [Deltaproteobacteria bacterium]|nr:PAS domain S-box protein [Deltaproteobacteria bacterium]
MLLYQMIVIAFTIAFFMMVSRRLYSDIESHESRQHAFLSNFQGIAYQFMPHSYHALMFEGRAEGLTGLPAQEFSNGQASWIGFIHADDLSMVTGRYETALANPDRPYGMEYRIYHPSGEIRWVSDIGQCHFQGGFLQVLQGTIQDITDQKNSQAVLAESEQKFASAFHTSPYAITITRASDGKIIDVNEAFCDVTGYTMPECIGRSTNELNLWVKIDDRLKVVADLAAGKKVTSVEFPFKRKNGELMTGLFSAQMLRINNEICVLSSIADITERKKTEQALAESEERYRIITNNMNDIVWLMDMDFRVIYINPAAVKTRGFTLEEFQTMPIESHFPQSSAEAFFQVLAEELTPERLAQKDLVISRTMTLDFFRKDGSIIPAEVTMTMVRDLNGSPMGFVGVGRDITERIAAQEAQEKLTAQLRQAAKMEAVGRLAGGVAHDFNNMLSVIMGHAEMALEGILPSNPLYDDLEEIRQAATRSADLTRQLLAFARKQVIAPSVLDLNETIEGLLKMLSRIIGEDMRLIWNPAPDLWAVKMDPAQIDQILVNLAVNAKDAVDGEGRLSIETANVSLDENFCKDHAGAIPGDFVCLTVGDDGCGMDRETVERLFEPFFTTKEMGAGTGLGLSTVYGIVKQNNGFIYVYSEKGWGSTFQIFFPKFSRVGASMPESFSTQAARTGAETILLVEDEPPLLKIAKMTIQKLGYTVLAADGPTRALKLSDEHEGVIGLLVTDVIMPEMNGKDLYHALLKRRPGLKCLFMSGYTANVIAQHGVLDENMHFLQKPFSRDSLSQMIRRAIEADHEKT